MPQLDVVCDMGISFNVDNSWTSWTLDTALVLAILVKSDFSWTWDWCHWNFYLVLFPCICRTCKSDFVCVMCINLKLRWSWTLSWTQIQTLEFRIGLDLYLCAHLLASPVPS
jgi:hypothetical protein